MSDLITFLAFPVFWPDVKSGRGRGISEVDGEEKTGFNEVTGLIHGSDPVGSSD
ncbi:MAG: hypothetical protein ACKVJU_13200 [Verrucomicrobiales bacterium]